ncbi:50S ribosomal protein L31 [bacterium]|nr:50S ribosomal protein L31 [bacterium]
MKEKIHPTYYPNAKIICACGAVFTVGSTIKEMHVEVCSHCHPFFTGKQKLVDKSGQIEKYKARLEKRDKLFTAQKKPKKSHK